MAAVKRGGGGYASAQSRILMTDGGLSKLLKTLPKEGKREIRKAVIAWSKNVRDRARALAPVARVPIDRGKRFRGKAWKVTQPGTLRDSIRIGVFAGGLAAKAGVFGERRKVAFYAHFVEYGTAPHYNVAGAKRKQVIRNLVRNGKSKHPGSRAQPFLRPAARAAGQAGAAEVVAAIRRALAVAVSGGAGQNLLPIETMLARLERDAAVARRELGGDPFAGEAVEG